MINKDRIVPIQAIDLISLYAVILKQNTADNETLEILPISDGIPGNFRVTQANGRYICSEPVKKCNFLADSIIYFVPDYNFEGFTSDGEAIAPTAGSAAIVPDGCTLYIANYSNDELTVNLVGLRAADSGQQ